MIVPLRIKLILWLLGDTPLIANSIWTPKGFEFKEGQKGYVHKFDMRFK